MGGARGARRFAWGLGSQSSVGGTGIVLNGGDGGLLTIETGEDAVRFNGPVMLPTDVRIDTDAAVATGGGGGGGVGCRGGARGSAPGPVQRVELRGDGGASGFALDLGSQSIVGGTGIVLNGGDGGLLTIGAGGAGGGFHG